MAFSEKEICCNYRNIGSYMTLAILIPFGGFLLYCAIVLRSIIIGLMVLGLLLYLIYFIIWMMNKKTILTEEKIYEYDFWGKCKEYDLCEVTQIIVHNSRKWHYTKIFVNRKKIEIKKHATNYGRFQTMLCKLYGLEGYSKGGTHIYDL